jgi:hypothetical protein
MYGRGALKERVAPRAGAGPEAIDECSTGSSSSVRRPGSDQLEHDLIFEQVIPELLAAGMTGEQLETTLVENPKRWLGR